MNNEINNKSRDNLILLNNANVNAIPQIYIQNQNQVLNPLNQKDLYNIEMNNNFNNLEENNIINIDHFETLINNNNNNQNNDNQSENKNIIPQFNYNWIVNWIFNIIKNSKNNIKKILEVYVHILILITFETFFYFEYLTNIEKQILNKTIDDIIKLLEKYQDYNDYDLSPTQKAFIEQECSLSKSAMDSHNEKLYTNAMKMIIIMYSFMIFLICLENIANHSSNPPQKTIFWTSLKNSLTIMIFISLFEVIFFYQFILQYQLTDSNQIVCKIYREMYE